MRANTDPFGYSNSSSDTIRNVPCILDTPCEPLVFAVDLGIPPVLVGMERVAEGGRVRVAAAMN